MPAAPTARQLALYCAHSAAEKGAEEVRVLELPIGAESDFAVLASARSERQCYAIADEVHHFCKRNHIARHPVEGQAGWILVDCHHVVVHVQGEAQRQYYDLDRLWPDAVDVAWEKELKKLPALADGLLPDELPPDPVPAKPRRVKKPAGAPAGKPKRKHTVVDLGKALDRRLSRKGPAKR